MTATEAQVLEALRAVQDPDLHRDIVALDLIRDLQICGANLAFTIALPTPVTDAKERMKDQAERAAAAVPGIDKVAVLLRGGVPAKEPGYEQRPGLPGVRHVIAVSSGKGGVGKSTVAVNLACSLQRLGSRVGLLDADVYGPNLPMMLGLSGQPHTENDKLMPFVRDGMPVMSIGLMVAEDQPVVWRGPMLHSAIGQFLFDVDWGELDMLVVDMPPGTGDAQLSLAQHVHLGGAIIVTTPQAVSVHDVRKAMRMFETVKVPILGVVENMAWFSPPGSDQRFEIFGKGGGERMSKEFGVPLLGSLPLDPAVREGGDAGQPLTLAEPESEVSVAFLEVARQVAARIEELDPVPPRGS